MNLRFTLYTFLLLFCLSSLTAYAQPPSGRGGGGMKNIPLSERPKIGDLSGIILDVDSREPIEFATISLMSQKDSTLVSGGITDKKGEFYIPELPPGRFFAKVSFIAYNDEFVQGVRINPREPSLNLGEILLSPKSEILKEITVKEDRALVTNAIDRKVINVAKTLTSAGGDVTDVLKEVPSIEVDVDGNVSMRGSSNLTILIDGRPSGLVGDGSSVLEQIPANAVETIELITNPSAKYDPDGMSGIINIVMKKNQKGGINGSVNGSIGTGQKYTAGLNLNYRTSKYNIFGSYSYQNRNRWMSMEFDRHTFGDFDDAFTDQDEEGNRYREGHVIKAGFDYYINRKNTLTFTTVLGPGSSGRDEDIYAQYLDENESLEDVIFRDNEEDEDETDQDYSLLYTRKFKKPKQELRADVRYSTSQEGELGFFSAQNLDVNFDPVDNAFLYNNFTNEDRTIMNGQVDYTHPLSEESKLELGYKTSYRNINTEFLSESWDTSSDSFTPDDSLNNEFDFDEQLHALYGTYGQSIKKFSYQLGVRLEQVFTESKLAGSEEAYVNDYFSVFPSVHLSQKVGKGQELGLSYSRRIRRPHPRQLNPFPDYSDPLNLRQGNPYLNPEYTNSYELTYSKIWDKVGLNTSLYYRHTTDAMRRDVVIGEDGIFRVSSVNFGQYFAYGLEAMFNIRALKWWRINTGFNIYESVSDGTNIEDNLEVKAMNWTGNLMSNMSLPNGIELQISGRYRSPFVIPRGKISGFSSMDAAVKKDVLKGRGNIGFRVSDIFNTRQFRIELDDDNYTQTTLRKRESRIAYLSFSYRFGEMEKSKRGRRGNRGMDSGGFDGGDMF